MPTPPHPVTDSDALAGLAGRLVAARRWTEAEAVLRRLAARDPGEARHYGNLGLVRIQLGRRGDAAAALKSAVRLDPAGVSPRLHLGNLYREGQAWSEAASCYRAVLALRPDEARAEANLGALGRAAAGSADTARHLERALRLRPDLAEASADLGVLRFKMQRPDGALAAFRRAAVLRPDVAETWTNTGVVVLGNGDYAAALTALRRALALRPDYVEAYSNLLFALCFIEDADLDAVYREHRRFSERFVEPLARRAPPHANDRSPERRLRVGYVSADYRNMPAANFLLPVFEHHDPAQVEVVAYHNGAAEDAVTDRFRRAAALWRPCLALSDEDLARTIRDDGIDILVDCEGHMAGSRILLFGHRPAPVQVSYPLYPNTTGLRCIDYRITDVHMSPASADRLHAERLVRLPEVHAPYVPVSAATGAVPAPEPPCLTTGVFTFASFNNPAKLGASTIAAWSRILRETTGTRLLLKWRGFDRPETTAPIHARFAAHGVGEGRVVFAGWAPDPYTPYRAVDLCLDPLFPNGGTTTCDALWMGVPVVSLVGEAFFARVGLSFLRNVGLPDLLATTVDEYVAIARRLAGDPARLAALRQGLRERFERSPIPDAALYTRRLEAAYRTMWRRWCAGEPPVAFHVPAVPGGLPPMC